MTTACKSAKDKKKIKMPVDEIILSEYKASLGAPFEIVLHDAVRQTICSQTGRILETRVPNMGGLLKEVAVARTLHPRKFSADEIKFLRKAVNLKASELATLLGISAEHLSRCENRDRVLSVAAEKLFRVIVLKRRFNLTELENWADNYLSNDNNDENAIKKLRHVMAEYRECLDDVEKAVFNAKISTVHDPDELLSFSFRLREGECSSVKDARRQEDEQWKRAA